MLQEIVLTGWALTMALAAAVSARAVMVLRRSHSAPADSTLDAPEASRVAVERLLAEVGGVVDLIEADAARLERFEDTRTLHLARSLLASSITRYQESTASDG